MKKILALVFVFIMMLSLAACGSKDSKKDSEKKEETTAENMKYGFYISDAQLTLIKSLGKCEDNAKIVVETVMDSQYYINVTVYTWTDSNAKFDSYKKYFIFNPGSAYQSHLNKYESDYVMIEKNDDAKWFCVGLNETDTIGQTGFTTYSEILNYYNSGTNGDLVK